MWIKTHRCLVAWNTHNLSMHHLLKHINQDIKGDKSKDKDSTVNKTEYPSNRIPTGKPQWSNKHLNYQAPTILSIDKSLSQNRHRGCRLIHWRAIKEEIKVANSDWVDQRACSLLQYILVRANLFIMENYFNELRWKLLEHSKTGINQQPGEHN